MNNINERQNQDRFIEYLKAQRVAYSQCKMYQIFDLISVLTALVLPIIGLYNIGCINLIIVLSFIWGVLYLIADRYRKKKSNQGAKIQEEFDTELFGIPWNDILCKKKISKDIQVELASKYNKKDLNDWYSKEIENTLPQEIAVLLCQRINSSWDAKQKENYKILLLVVTVIYYTIFIIIFLKANLGIYDIILLLSPSMSFLIYSVQNICSINDQISEKEDNIEFIDNLIDEYRRKKNLPSVNHLRQIQDVIYHQRSVPEKVPDWFYRIFKTKNENTITTIIKFINT